MSVTPHRTKATPSHTPWRWRCHQPSRDPSRLQPPTLSLLIHRGEAILGHDVRRGLRKRQLGDGERVLRRPPVSPVTWCWSTGRYHSPGQ